MISLSRQPPKRCAASAINRSWEGETIQQHPNVHLAFGVAIEDGLVTPIIRAAETKGLREIGAEAKALIKSAREEAHPQ